MQMVQLDFISANLYSGLLSFLLGNLPIDLLICPYEEGTFDSAQIW